MDEISDELISSGYENLFMRLDMATLDSLWNKPGNPQKLATLAIDDQAPVEARFLAAEILFHKQPGYPPIEVRTLLAPIYAFALRHARSGNSWGLPETLDGSSGQHFVQLGEAAVTALIPLLEDSRPLRYMGSHEATLGNSYSYRVKDLAAFYISKIRNIPYTVHRKSEARDPEIAALHSSLKSP